MKRAQILSGLAGLAVAASGSAALAQRSLYPLPQPQQPAEQPYAEPRAPEGNFDRDRNVSVRERARPDYQAEGIRLGGVGLYPKLTVGAEQDDNVYAVANGPVDDTIYTVQPELILQAGSGSSQIEAFARAGRRMNEDYVKESTTDYQVGGSGSYVTSGIRLTGGGDYGRYTEPRTAPTTPTGAAKPIRYKLGQANIGASYEMDRLRVSGGVELQDYDFKDGRDAATGAEVEQDDRDRRILTYTAKAEYALTPDTSVFLVSAFDDRRYDRRPPAAALNRDSQGIDVAVGTSFDISAVARGEIQIGYVKQDYDALVDIKGLTGKASFDWFPTELTTVSLTGSRQVRDATVPGAGGFMSGNYGVQVDQELLDNLILTARGGYGLDTYKGIDREDKRTSGYVGANYLLSRNLGFTLAYDYLKQKSSGAAPGQSFEDSRVSLSSSLQF